MGGGLIKHFFVINRMQFRYPLVKAEIVDIFVGERRDYYLHECINCV